MTSVHARAGQDVTEFYQNLAQSVAELVGAQRVLFWQLDEKNMLSAVPGGYGVDATFMSRLVPVACDPEGQDLQSQVVFKDVTFRAAAGDEVAEAIRARHQDAAAAVSGSPLHLRVNVRGPSIDLLGQTA